MGEERNVGEERYVGGEEDGREQKGREIDEEGTVESVEIERESRRGKEGESEGGGEDGETES